MKKQLAQKMLDEKLDFLPVNESIALYNSGEILETKFWWVVNSEELSDDDGERTLEETLQEAINIYGEANAAEIGDDYNHFDEFTFKLCPAPTYIDLIK